MSAAASHRLVAAWETPPTIIGYLGAVNHKIVGVRFLATAFLFLLVGGVEALLIRVQLIVPQNDFLGPQAYNELFTMHGTTMMFLFAVPFAEGLGTYLVPLMLGTRDMPFPRLNAFGYWAYLFGALFLHASFLTGRVPDGGWFAYPPFTGPVFSPDDRMDFWLLGVTLVEVSGVVFAIEMLVLVLKQRAPGMTLARMPLFVWSMVTTAGMMLFAFPTLIVASVLLELDRKVGTHFYDPEAGGSPALWQHLFWFFGHPEVYIMLLPAVGVISMIVSTFSRTPIVGYTLLVFSTLAIGIISFGLWVHHMYAVGLPLLVTAFFGGASFAIAIPSGVQVFGWLATMWRGGRRIVWSTPMLYVAGFLLVFVLGGMTGVMVAAVPFDLQAHDSFFVVAHFHYVLIGGVLFPFLAALHFWWPKLTGRVLDERLGHAAFWPILVGFNLTFFPQHFVGLLGMPRRVYTYQAGLDWTAYNVASTVGAFVLAAGIAVFVANAVLSLRRLGAAGPDPWLAGTLEWAADSPPAPYNFRRLPVATSRDPLWGPAPAGREEEPLVPWGVALDDSAWEGREVIVTTELDAEPEEVARLPGPSLVPLWLGVGVSAALAGILVDEHRIAAIGGAGAVLAGLAWARSAAAGEGMELERDEPPPRRSARPLGWWGAVFSAVALATGLGALLVSVLYLRTAAPVWPPADAEAPGVALTAGAGAAALFAAVLAAGALVVRREGSVLGARAGLVAATVFAVAATALQTVQWVRDAPVPEDAYSSVVAVLPGAMAAFAIAGVLLLAVAQSVVWRGGAGPRPQPVGVATVYWAFLAASWPAYVLVVHVLPRLGGTG